MVACASKNRSEGEKVRVSDDIILSSVSSERYLHLAPLSNTEKERILRSIDLCSTGRHGPCNRESVIRRKLVNLMKKVI